MDNIVNRRLTPEQKQFLDSLSKYIEQPLYFYGSVKRPDFIPGKSDIDIDIFTDNENSTINLLCNFLNVKKNEFTKFLLKIDGTLVYGYKVRYEDNVVNINAEFSVYNIKHKTKVLKERNNTECLPFHSIVLLYIIKVLFYKLQVISSDTFKRCKRFIMNNDELKFILID
jgi:hypothetical protein